MSVETDVPHGVLSYAFNVDILQHCLLMFNRLDFEGTLNDQGCSVNLIIDNISSRIFH